MIVRIRKLSVVDGRVEVTFNSPCGEGRALWLGPSVPVPGQEYGVELQIPETLLWGETIVPVRAMGGLIEADSESPALSLIGQIEHAPADGGYVFRIGDSIVLLDVAGAPAEPALTGSFVALKASAVELFDMTL